MKSVRTLLLVLLALAMLAGACASEADDSVNVGADPTADDSDDNGADKDDKDDADTGDGPSDAASYPVTIESGGATTTLDEQPDRVVSLSPTATEILFAIGYGSNVVAADAFSNYPPEAPTTDLSGFDPNAEAVLAFEPDLVVIQFDANDLTASLTEAGVAVLVQPTAVSLDDAYGQIADLGIATSHVDDAADVVSQMREDIASALADAPDTPVRIYHEIDETFYSASSSGFVGAVYAEMGVTNIADEADGAESGFPQLGEEFIIEADPELIIITDQVTYSPDDVAARPGWDEITAVQNGNVVVVNADVASRWGPRIVELIEVISEALQTVAKAEANA